MPLFPLSFLLSTYHSKNILSSHPYASIFPYDSFLTFLWLIPYLSSNPLSPIIYIVTHAMLFYCGASYPCFTFCSMTHPFSLFVILFPLLLILHTAFVTWLDCTVVSTQLCTAFNIALLISFLLFVMHSQQCYAVLWLIWSLCFVYKPLCISPNTTN